MILNRLELAIHSLRGRLRLGKDVFIDRGAVIDFRSERGRCSSGSLQIGSGTTLCRGAIISLYGGDIRIGVNAYIGPYTVIYGHGGVCIGDNVLIANHSTIVSSAHNFKDFSRPIAEQGEVLGKILIEDDVWIGSGARILSGVQLCKGAVVGANSVVTKTVEAFSVSYGVPAKCHYKRV